MKAALLASTSIYAILSDGYRLLRRAPLSANGSTLPQPLQSIVNDIFRCIEAEIYYPAVAVALTLPDICVGLTLDNDVFVTQKTYMGFIDKYAPQPDLGVDAQDCYRLRCGVIHRANAAGHPHIGMSHIIFTTPKTAGAIHGMALVVGEQEAGMLDLVMFCRSMVAALKSWYASNKDDPKVRANIPLMLHGRPEGVPPFILGDVVASGPLNR